MNDSNNLKNLGFSQYEITCYLSLVARHPCNGSQLSRLSGIARSRIYDVLRNMIRKGLALEVDSGQYVPLPADELLKRLRGRFETDLSDFEKQIKAATQETSCEYIWTLQGYTAVIEKAREMIASARTELYIRLFPKSAELLEKELHEASARGVGIRYIAMGEIPPTFDIQVIHPNSDSVVKTIGGCSFDVISDRAEALSGIFETGMEETSDINWSRNTWFIITCRDSLRHDFYHYFLEKTYDRKQDLTDHEKHIYAFIKADD